MTLWLRIGPATIAIVADRLPDDVGRPNYRPFLSVEPRLAALTIRVRVDPPPPRDHASPIGEVPAQWALYRADSGYRLEVFEQIQGRPRQIVLLSEALDRADVHLLEHPGMPEYPRARWFLALLMNPLIQWWLTAHLALRGDGLIVHAAAAVLNGRGLAFVGPSGAGKTTVVRWCRERGAVVLNDERILIWRDAQGFRVGGTPWHGELPEVSSSTAPLGRVFLLAHGETNRFSRWRPARAVAQVVPEAFLPIWSPEAMAGLLHVSERLVREVPTGELRFVNSPTVGDYLGACASQPVAQGLAPVEVR